MYQENEDFDEEKQFDGEYLAHCYQESLNEDYITTKGIKNQNFN